MLKTIRDSITDEVVDVVETNPVCGKDFCDRCGDCFYCYGEDPCIEDGEYYWVEYKEKEIVTRERRKL